MLTHPGVPPHHIELKKGTVCALQRNLSVEKGLVKNKRVVIEALHRRFVQVRVVDRDEVHCIPRIMFSFRPPYSDWTVNRRQLPLRLAYATTFNGCQGLTLRKAALDCRTDVFAHGQLYTALSRVRTRDDCLMLFPPDTVTRDAANVVYEDLLL